MLDVLSMIPGVVWPSIPNGRASQLLAMQFQLEQSQWLTAEELLANQSRQLGVLYQHAYQTVPFYRRRLDEAELPPSQMHDANAWSKVPVLTRRDIQEAGRDLHCVHGPQEHGPITTTITSGSSGQPVTTLGTTVTRQFLSALILRQHLWHRRDFRLKLAAIRSLKEAQTGAVRESISENWGLGTIDIVNTGPAFTLDIHSSVEEQAEFLLTHDPEYFLSYPSVIMALAEHFARSERRLSRLREVRSFGEVLEPQVRSACNKVWGVKVVDNYSSQEFGDIAVQCPDHEHYHVQAENVLVEVLDDSGRACPAGEIGRIVVTSLHNFAMPLIRYEIGDFAEVGQACPCGRGLPVLNRIVGRQRNMFTLPDGRRVWPSIELSADETAGDFPPIQQFQVIQRTMGSADLLLVTPRLLTNEETELVRRWIDRGIGYELELKITYVREIPRGATGKYEDFRSDVSVES